MKTMGNCSDKQISFFEEKHHVHISDDLKEFLMENNGAIWEEGIYIPVPSLSEGIYVDALFGIGLSVKWLDMDYWLEKYANELPPETLIIGSDVLEGFLLKLNIPEAMGIYYWDDKLNLNESTISSNCYFVCNSFDEIVKCLLKEG